MRQRGTFEALRRLPWTWRLGMWWDRLRGRSPVVHGEIGRYEGVRFVEHDDG